MNRTRIEFLSFLTAFDRLMLELRRQTNYGPYSCKFLSGGRVLELDKKKSPKMVAVSYGSGSLRGLFTIYSCVKA